MTDSTTSNVHRVAVAGASGRMGHMLIEAVQAADDCRLSGALDIAGSPALGSDAAAFTGTPAGVAIVSDLRQGLAGSQVLIDFTRPEGTLSHLAVCRELGVRPGKALVSGSRTISVRRVSRISAGRGAILSWSDFQRYSPSTSKKQSAESQSGPTTR